MQDCREKNGSSKHVKTAVARDTLGPKPSEALANWDSPIRDLVPGGLTSQTSIATCCSSDMAIDIFPSLIALKWLNWLCSGQAHLCRAGMTEELLSQTHAPATCINYSAQSRHLLISLSSCTRLNSKQIKALNKRPDALNLIKEKVRNMVQHTSTRKDFLSRSCWCGHYYQQLANRTSWNWKVLVQWRKNILLVKRQYIELGGKSLPIIQLTKSIYLTNLNTKKKSSLKLGLEMKQRVLKRAIAFMNSGVVAVAAQDKDLYRTKPVQSKCHRYKLGRASWSSTQEVLWPLTAVGGRRVSFLQE